MAEFLHLPSSIRHLTSEGAVAHAARSAQCRDDGGDDAADDLEDGLPRFLVLHGIRWFLGVNNLEGAF